MKLPKPENVDAGELAESLCTVADIMITADGDRDHMNQSRLNCAQVQTAFKLMLMAADKLREARKRSPTHE